MTAQVPSEHEERWDERLVQTAQGYVSRAWRHRARETLHQARRYSIFVRIMKGALPTAALVLLGVVLVCALQPRDTGSVKMSFERLGTVEGDRAMVNMRLTGSDQDGLPFVVNARSAVQEDPAATRVSLNGVQAEMTLRDGTLLQVSAAKGFVDGQNKSLAITGGITFTTSNGYEAETASASADLAAGTISGTAPITAHSPFGRVTANGFLFDKATGKFTFTGEVRMQIDQGAP